MAVTDEGREAALKSLIMRDGSFASTGKRQIRVLNAQNEVQQTLNYEQFIWNDIEKYVVNGANPIEFTMTEGQSIAKVQITALPTGGLPVWEEPTPAVREFPNGGIYRIPLWIIKIP